MLSVVLSMVRDPTLTVSAAHILTLIKERLTRRAVYPFNVEGNLKMKKVEEKDMMPADEATWKQAIDGHPGPPDFDVGSV